jgi:hypothetical protein
MEAATLVSTVIFVIVSFLAGRIEQELDVAAQVNAGGGDLRVVFRFGQK